MALDTVLSILVGLAVIGELVIIFGNIIAREVFKSPVLWTDELGQLALTSVAFLGGALAYTRNEYIAVHSVVNRLPKTWRPAIDAFVEWMVVAVCAIGTYYSLAVIKMRWNEWTAVLETRMG